MQDFSHPACKMVREASAIHDGPIASGLKLNIEFQIDSSHMVLPGAVPSGQRAFLNRQKETHSQLGHTSQPSNPHRHHTKLTNIARRRSRRRRCALPPTMYHWAYCLLWTR